MNSLELKTQDNATIANKTNDVASKTNSVAKTILKATDDKEFYGKIM